MKTYIGIDNGTTGSIGIINSAHNIAEYVPTPSFYAQSYTKKKQNVSRIRIPDLMKILSTAIQNTGEENGIFAFIERPFVNPGMFKASISAVRAMEATIICLEMADIPYQYIDSKEWQKLLLPAGCKGAELKKASTEIGNRLFPSLRPAIQKQGDADGILIAEYARRRGL